MPEIVSGDNSGQGVEKSPDAGSDLPLSGDISSASPSSPPLPPAPIPVSGDPAQEDGVSLSDESENSFTFTIDVLLAENDRTLFRLTTSDDSVLVDKDSLGEALFSAAWLALRNTQYAEDGFFRGFVHRELMDRYLGSRSFPLTFTVDIAEMERRAAEFLGENPPERDSAKL